MGIVLVVITLGLWSFIYLFGKAMCGDEPIEKYQSPDSKHEIIYYIRDCGATTGFVDHVEIDGTTLLISEAKDGKIPALHLNWVTNKEISIEVSTTTRDLRVYRKPLDSYKDINISLDPKITRSYGAYLNKMEVQ